MIISTHERTLDLCDTLKNYFEKLNIDTCTKPDDDSPTFQEQSQEVQGKTLYSSNICINHHGNEIRLFWTSAINFLPLKCIMEGCHK